MHPLQWLSRRDHDLLALRRAGRTAIVMPAMFAVGEQLIGNPTVATFAAFGSFAMLLLVDFGGPLRDRLRAQVALALAGSVLICLATVASRNVWLAAVAMTVVGFGVIFAGVVSSVLAGAATSLLLAFILPVTLAEPLSSVPDRLAGWGIAAAASLLAVTLLWPAPTRDPLRAAATTACRALAARLRAEVALTLSRGEEQPQREREREHAVAAAERSVGALHRGFLAAPSRPSSLTTSARAIVRLVDELNWLNAIVVESEQPIGPVRGKESACAVKVGAATVLERGAELLEVTGGESAALRDALADLSRALNRIEESASAHLPAGIVGPAPGAGELRDGAGELLTSLDPSFRAQELGFAVALIARNIDLAAAAERRSWWERLLGRQPEGLAGSFAVAHERATAHVDRNSVWLHNSVRGAVGLGLAVLIANRTGVQHAFWVVLGTLSVLRSNALSTGQTVLRGLVGTVAGFMVGAALLAVIGSSTTLLWLLLPAAILFAGIAPAVIGFAAGQAAFTLTLVFLFNIIQPAGWRVGLLRVEDIALGCAVSLFVGLLFWPRGAGAALRRALADAYAASAEYLASAVAFGMARCDAGAASAAAVADRAARAAAASRRLDDAFRGYLAERGAKSGSLAEVTGLLTGVGGLRLAADAVLDLWQREDGTAPGDRAIARGELLSRSVLVKDWYEDLARSILDGREPRQPLARDSVADGRFLEAVRRDLGGQDAGVSATAVRMIWTGDHLDAARRLQGAIFAPARAASGIAQAPA